MRKNKGEGGMGDYASLIPPVIDDIERIPVNLKLRSTGGGGGRRLRQVRDVTRIDRARYTPEGKVVE